MTEEIRIQYRSIQDIVFTTLRDEIVSHVLKPGDTLNTVELSKRLGVSRTPIREALNRLISIGLVEESSHRSCCVKTFSADQMVEIYFIRAALSGVAARLAATQMSAEGKARLTALCDEMETLSGSEQAALMLEKNREFHSLIIQAARSPRLEDLLGQYYSQSQQYRALALELPNRHGHICDEHRGIARAIAACDKEGAETATREHYFNTARCIARAFDITTEI